jgi:small subunit ribosomal protein S4
MSRYTGPKNKLSRRAGIDLFDKGPKLRRLNIPPGVHGPKGSRYRPSDYSLQLREKQKAKHTYGLYEKQFRRYFNQASKQKADTGKVLIQLLERRLDNTVYRLKLAPTRPMARQLVVHGHVKVNNHIVDRPSYRIKPDQTITLSSQALEIPAVKTSLDNRATLPSWLEAKGPVGHIKHLPQRDKIETTFDEQLIIEYYSR